MSGFFYKLSPLGDNVKLHMQFAITPISAKEFLSKHNHQNFSDMKEQVFISETEIKAGEPVFVLGNFLRADVERYKSRTLPVLVKGSNAEQLKKDILDNMDLLWWNAIDDVWESWEMAQLHQDRWNGLSSKLDQELPDFMKDLCRSLPLRFIMPETEDWNGETTKVRVKVTLCKGYLKE